MIDNCLELIGDFINKNPYTSIFLLALLLLILVYLELKKNFFKN